MQTVRRKTIDSSARADLSKDPPHGKSSSSSGSFITGFLTGQLSLALILFFFIRFFLFGEAPSPDIRATARAVARKQRTVSHTETLRRRSAAAAAAAAQNNGRNETPLSVRVEAPLTPEEILEKTYYNVDGHQPESLDWINVLVAQTVAQLRTDALNDDALLSSLTRVLNGSSRPSYLDEIKVTDIALGDAFPIFSNCRVLPVDSSGAVVKPIIRKGGRHAGFGTDSSLQARMQVDLSDVLTLAIETKLVLNYPKPCVAVLPVALSVSVERFSGTLAMSFNSSKPTNSTSKADGGANALGAQSPTMLTFTFLDDYRLDLSVKSLVGSRSRLQDVPKIAQLIEQQLHTWFDDRCVEPRFQQVTLPSLWPRKKNVRGNLGGDVAVDSSDDDVVDGDWGPATPPEPVTIPRDLDVDKDDIARAGADLRQAELKSRRRRQEGIA